MRISSFGKEIGAKVATTTGYPKIVRRAINLAPVRDTMHISDGSCVERGTRLAGDITLASGTHIETGSHLSGDVTIAENAHIGPNSKVTGCASIGRYTNLTEDIEFIGGEIHVGRYTPIGRRTTFQPLDHSMHQPSLQWKFYSEVLKEDLEMVSKGPIRVGSDVWIGMNVTVLGGVEIGHGAVVGAGAIVTKDVEPYSIVAGVPAERKGWRFDEPTRNQLLKISWWGWDEDTMQQNKSFFTTDLRDVDNILNLID